MIIDGLAALIVLVMLLTRRKAKNRHTLQVRLIHALMVCCAWVLLIDIPGLLLNGYGFPGARALLWVFDTAYWALHILYCWLWTVFTDAWNAPDAPGLKRRAIFYLLPALLETAIIVSNPWTGWLFVLDGQNCYAPGAAYQLCLLPHW